MLVLRLESKMVDLKKTLPVLSWSAGLRSSVQEVILPDICFVGTNALDAEQGLTDNDWEVVQVKKAMIKSAAQLAVLTISEKLNSAHKMTLCSPDKIDYLITELNPDDKRMASYKKKIQII